MVRQVRTQFLVDNSATALFCRGMLLKQLDYKVVNGRSAEDALKVLELDLPAITGV